MFRAPLIAALVAITGCSTVGANYGTINNLSGRRYEVTSLGDSFPRANENARLAARQKCGNYKFSILARGDRYLGAVLVDTATDTWDESKAYEAKVIFVCDGRGRGGEL